MAEVRNLRPRSLPLLLAALILGMLAGANAEEHWPQFRGPTGRGHSTATDVPLKWSAGSVVWKTKLALMKLDRRRLP